MDGDAGVRNDVLEHFELKKLQERVWRLQAENKELKELNSILDTQFKTQREMQADIFKMMQANMEENSQKTEASDKRISELERLLELKETEFKDRLEEERSQGENRQNGLKAQIDDLENKLFELTEFRKNKESMEAELSSLRARLEEQAEAHQGQVSEFDRKKAIEIARLKDDMQRSIKETREMLKAKTKDQLELTTRRTIMENEQMATELHFQSRETERLIDRNQQLMEENAQLRRNLLIHKDLESELARRTHVYQKLIKKMDQKQKADDASKSMRLDESTAPPEGDSGHDHSISNMQGLSRELPSMMSMSMPSARGLEEEAEKLRRQVEGASGSLQLVRTEFQQYRRDHATLTQLQDQSTRLIIAALYELKNQRECDPFPPATYDEHANWQFANMTPKQKEYFFRVLLEKLNSSMCGSCFPTGAQPTQSSSTSLPQIHGNFEGASGRGGTLSPQHSKHDDQAHISQFLWSVASHGGHGQAGGGGGGAAHQHQHESRHASLEPAKDMATKSVQTETSSSDPCLKEGLWNPTTRSGFSQSVTPGVVAGGVRQWGAKAKPGRRTTGATTRLV